MTRRTWHGLADIPDGWGPCVVTIGAFDGVHRGHAALIERTVQLARAREVPAVLVTFDPHPATVVGPARDISTLSTPGRRAELVHQHGVDAVLVLPFGRELADVAAHDFVRRVLVDALGAGAVVVGQGFRFGAQGRGDLDMLQDLGRSHDFLAEAVDLLRSGDSRCSSTYIRQRLAAGDVAAAAEALGRPHRIPGILAANTFSPTPGFAVPGAGRYRALLSSNDRDQHPVHVTVGNDHWIGLDAAPPLSDHCIANLDFMPRRATVGRARPPARQLAENG